MPSRSSAPGGSICEDSAGVHARQQLIDQLWDFDDPAGSAARFDRALAGASASERSILLAQIARARGLERRFQEAHAILDGVPLDTPEVRVRVLLERGRVLISGDDGVVNGWAELGDVAGLCTHIRGRRVRGGCDRARPGAA